MTLDSPSLALDIRNPFSSADPKTDPMINLENALQKCEFGWFHIKLLLGALASMFSCNLIVTLTSFVVPNAECDLDLSLNQKGMLTGAAFLGQIGASFVTGILTDAFGRRPFLIGGHVALFVLCILEGSSQTFAVMIVVKILQGIFACFSYNATPAMVSECSHKGIRNRMMIANSSFMALSSTVSALLSWAVLPQELNFEFFGGKFVIHSWNILLYISSFWSGLAAIIYYFLPETPKFLLAHGLHEESLDVLKKIYTENTRQSPETFPIKSLVDPFTPITKKKVFKEEMKDALVHIKDLFKMPLVFNLSFISGMVFVTLLSISSLRLWFPQISTVVENFSVKYGQTSSFCVMINEYTASLNEKSTAVFNVTENVTQDLCVPITSGTETYINGIIMGTVALIFTIIAGTIVDMVKLKPLVFVMLCAACLLCAALYWSNTSLLVAIIISLIVGLMQATFGLLNALFVRVFPTNVRTLALSIILMVGRVGSLAGSTLFPVLLQHGCMVPFGSFSLGFLLVAILSIFLPSVTKDTNDQ